MTIILATIQSVSGQNKRFASLGKESGNMIKSLIKKTSDDYYLNQVNQ
jgi:hypothetical protein